MLSGTRMLSFALLLTGFLVVGAADCELTLYVDGSQSVFNVTGIANSTLLQNIQLAPSFEEQKVGMMGSMKFRTNGGCPSTQRQLLRVLSSSNFTLSGKDDIVLYPMNATLLAASFARLDFLGLRFGYRWRHLGTDRAENRIRGNATLRVEEGMVRYEVNASLGFNVEPGEAPLEDLRSHQIQEAEMTINGSRIRFEIPRAVFSFTTEVEPGIDLLPVIEATLNLTGRIVAEAFVECSETMCGNNGRCVALETGENVCDCACGWTGDTCEIPSGFCDVYGDVDTSVRLNGGNLTENEPQAPVSARQERRSRADLIEQCEELFTDRQCPDERSQFNINAQQCVCVAGWKGEACDLCEPGNACPDYFEQGAACVTDGTYDARSGEKTYECDLRSTGLDIFIGSYIKFVCNTTGPRFNDLDFQQELADNQSISPIGNTPFCTVEFTFQGTTPVNCTAWECTYQPGSRKVKCGTMDCECEDCQTIIGLVNGINSVELECDDQNDCRVFFGGLGIPVDAPCVIGECLLPSNPDFTAFGSDDSGFEVNWDIFIISLPLVFVVGLLLLFALPALAMASRISASVLSVVGETKETKATESEGAEIRFTDVSCIVPMRSGTSRGQGWRSIFRNRIWSGETPKREQQQEQETLTDSAWQLVKPPVGFKPVLQGVTGTVHKGKLLGVIGPSGGGKTTFLSIICGISVDRQTRRTVNGKISVNGRKVGRWTKRLVAFVPQDDTLLSTLTVRESLMYSAVLRKPGCTMQEIAQKVNQTLMELNLQSVKHSYVGGIRGRRGISGGERRRVTIGMELVTDPSLVIMDEPTSGLDSYTALTLMQTLKNICDGGRTVILSVHQPTPAMLDMLDQVLLLARGYQIYLGPPSEAACFFERHGFTRQDDRVHIAEYMLQVVSDPGTLASLLDSINSTQEGSSDNSEPMTVSASEPEGNGTSPPRQSTFTSMQVLLWRGCLDIVRNPALLSAHVTVAVIIGVLCGVIFFDASLDIEGSQNRLGAAFFVLAFLGFWSLTTVDVIHIERTIVARETSSGYYNAYVYLISKILLDAVLLRVIPAVLLTLPLYFMMHLQRTVEKFVIFLFTVSTFNITVGLLAMAFTLLSPSPGTASLLINTILLVGLLFAGHLVNIPSMPAAVRWLHRISPFHYGFQVLAVNEMLGLSLNFLVPGLADVNGIGGAIFLRTIGIEDHNITHDLAAFAIYYVAALLLTFFSMWLTRHRGVIHIVSSFFFRRRQ